MLAVARQEPLLRQVAKEIPGVEVLPLDAADESAPSKVFGVLKPDILILCAGAFPPAAPLHEQSWQQFAVNWETDVKIALHFCKAALSEPLPGGASVILISSGAALAGSPNSGGYAGAKRTQLFIANYSQKESDRLGLGLRFSALAPRIMPAKPRRSQNTVLPSPIVILPACKNGPAPLSARSLIGGRKPSLGRSYLTSAL